MILSTNPVRDRRHRHGDGDECLSEDHLPADRWQRRPDCHTGGHTEYRSDIVCERHAGEGVADGLHAGMRGKAGSHRSPEPSELPQTDKVPQVSWGRIRT